MQYEKIGVKIGLEIHQQLKTNSKLFCSCTPIESNNHTGKFQRIMRTSKSELGEYDPAALFEKSKSNTVIYHINPQSNCLVEQDEEPPHELEDKAKNIALIIAATLKSNVFSEIYPMRKTVIDGSNTSGFQRTMLIANGGFYNVDEKIIKIQSICLEEDAARILGEENKTRMYSLDRLGIPLVEIATEPFEATPKEIKNIALSLGRILRSTKKVRRGIGTIRQDVNISIQKSNTVVEVKGVQQLEQLEKIVEYEVKRQYGLLQISDELKKRNIKKPEKINVTNLVNTWNSKIIKNAIKQNHEIILIKFDGLAGMFGKEYETGIRLGKDIAEIVRFFGLGGIFHSDELPAYGITQENIDELKHDIKDGDAFLLLAAPNTISNDIVQQIFLRMLDIANNGVPRDTRLATNGETKFLRPRPGAARMYPETDVPPIIITKEDLEEAKKNIPKSWDESISDIQVKYKLNKQLASQIFDSKYIELFEDVVKIVSVNPTFIASTLCSSIINFERNGLNSKLLKNDEITKTFKFLQDQSITKESVDIIFENIMSGKSHTVEEAIKNTAIKTINKSDLDIIINNIIKNNMEIINNQKERAIGPLMGILMKELRGKASGEIINKMLRENIKKQLE